MPTLEAARIQMVASLEALRRDFSSVRTGKASPALLDTVRVDAYGSLVPLNQVATVSSPEPRLLVVQPWDRAMLNPVEKAIKISDLGLNPANDGKVIRVPIPPLTEERRKEYVRLLHRMAEDGRVSIRQARKEANDMIKLLQKDGDLSEDDARRQQDEVQKLTDRHIQQLEELLRHKEAEVMEV
ncbi:MAG: ribosome recycling factor [Gemmatimonadota bacterium]|jgi:ribosome recycling factor|nr:ribosome recycling factor [Gemmatimonadota bacterium]